MSTNCAIGIRETDGTVIAIYCHGDGNPEQVGAILNAHYLNINKIRMLLALGDISSLGEKYEKDINKPHHIGMVQDRVTLAYARDCGEDYNMTKAKRCRSLDVINWGAYAYIYDMKAKKWLTYHYTNKTWQVKRLRYETRIANLIQTGRITRPKWFK